MHAWRCVACDRLTEKLPTACKEDGHAVERVDKVTKRMFRCAACGERTTSLGSIMPREACRHCSAESFVAINFAQFQVLHLCLLSLFGAADVCFFSKRQREVVDLLPTFRLNHEHCGDEALGVGGSESGVGAKRKRQWHDADDEERETKGSW